MSTTTYKPQLSLFGVLIMFSLLFMGADCKLGCFKTVRADLEQYFLPLQLLVNAPLQSAFSNFEEVDSLFKKHTELLQQIKALNQKNAYLMAENQKKQSLENENQNLKILLNVARTKKEKLVAANLVQVMVDPFSHYVILDKGKKEGVLENQAIIDTKGILGLINSSGPHTSKVRLLTDKAHAVPVQNSRNALRGIVSGTGKSDFLVLLHTPLTADYKVGDELLTSGLGGRFPVGYPVGVVSKVEHLPGQAFARIQVTPIANFSHMNHVLIVTEKLSEIKGVAITPASATPEVPVDPSITPNSIKAAPKVSEKPLPAIKPKVTSAGPLMLKPESEEEVADEEIETENNFWGEE